MSLTKIDLEKIKTAMIPDEQSHGLGTLNKNQAKINGAYFRRFWVKETRHPENHFRQKKVYLYRSMRLRIV